MILQKNITLKHLFINEQRMIGLQFYPDKIIQALVKQLPDHKWSQIYGMVYLKNTKDNLHLIFKTFKGVAWINGQLFFKTTPIKDNTPADIDGFRKRTKVEGIKYVPEIYLEKLELKCYAFNTCKVYINMFEQFMNFYNKEDINTLTELDIRPVSYTHLTLPTIA